MALVDAYRFIIFDYGGVLVEQQSEADQTKMAALLKTKVDIFKELYWARRLEYDKGALTAAEYWHDLACKTGAAVTVTTIEELIAIDTASWMHFDGVMWEWLDSLRAAGKRLAMLSNMPRELGEALKTRTGKLGLFHQVTLSYEVDSVKPEPAIYEHCLAGLGATPEDSFFFDDKIENVRGAERLGIRAEQFLDRDKVLSEALGG
jgi:putative hydrolase of the HAD superfamily